MNQGRMPQILSMAPIALKPYSSWSAPPRFGLRNIALFIGTGFFGLLYGSAFAAQSSDVSISLLVPVTVFSGAVIWALPSANRVAGGSLEILLFAFAIALICWPNYLAIALPSMPWITLTRVIALPLVVVLLVNLSTAITFKAALYDALNSLPLVRKFFIAFIVIQIFSVGFSNDTAYSANRLVVAQTEWTAIFFASCYVFLKSGRAEFFSKLIWLMALAMCCIAVFENSNHQVLWAGHIPAFLKIENPDVERILAGTWRSAIAAYRVQGTFSTSLGLAEYLALSMPFVLHLAATSNRVAIRFGAAISIPFLVYIVILTNSRLGMVGCLVSFLLYWIGWATLRWHALKRSLFGPAVVLSYPLMFCAAVAATFRVGRLHALVWGNGYQVASNQDRVTQLHKGLQLIAAHPWGYGIGMGGETLGYRDSQGILTIDNYYLSIALEYGILGLVLYYAMFLLAIYGAGKTIFAAPRTDRDCAMLMPAAIALVSFVIIKAVFSQQDNHPLVFMILGMIMALVSRANSGRKCAAKAIPI